jgi:glucosamine--fructose-6-phosphate aminotransferase (isomerizing)
MASASFPPIPTADRTAHPFYTYDMIHEIPASFRETIRRCAEPAAREAANLADRPFLAFTGSGTAFYAALLAQRYAAATPGDRIRSAAVTAFELGHYGPRMDRSSGAIGISHSGITKTTVDALRDARATGARTIGVTHFSDRPIRAVSDAVLLAGNSPDLSRCHTKCYAGGALAAAQVALEWRVSAAHEPRSRIEPMVTALEAMPQVIDKTIRKSEKLAEEMAQRHLARRSVGVFGAGPNLSTAFEAALKIRETSFLPVLGMEIEDFLHGSWQSLEPASLIFVVGTKGRSHARALDLARTARTVGTHVVAIASEGDRGMAEAATESFEVPEADELLSPFVNIIPLYLFAYFSSVKRGFNPDLLRYSDPTFWRARQIVFPPGTH